MLRGEIGKLTFIMDGLFGKQGYIYFGHLSPPPGGGGLLSKLKNREEFEGGHEKKEGKRRKKKRSLNDRKKIHKNREEFLEGIGKNFVCWPDLGYEPKMKRKSHKSFLFKLYIVYIYVFFLFK